MRKGDFRLILLCSAVPALMQSAAAWAQDGQAPATAQTTGAADSGSAAGVADIVVTATRQAQSLSRVPLSIAAYSQQTLDQQGVRGVGDVARLTPGVLFERSGRYGSTQSNITVRGIRSNSGIPTTGVYLDDTPIQVRTGVSLALVNPYPQVFDLDRVEVLRGPQGTLFGSGSVGGAVRFITPSPNMNSMSMYGRSEVSMTEHGGTSYEGGFAFGAPFVEDVLGFRASASYRHDGGFVDRIDRNTNALVDRDANSADSFVARIAFGWRPTEALTITPSLFFQRVDSNDTGIYVVPVSNEQERNYRQNNGIAQPSHDRFFLPALKVEYDFGPAVLISNTSYFDRKFDGTADTTTQDVNTYVGSTFALPPAGVTDAQGYGDLRNSQKTFTQEIRLQNNRPDARFNYVLGAFYSRAKIHDFYAFRDAAALRLINAGRVLRGLAPLTNISQNYFGVGLYQGTYALYIDNDIVDTQKAVFAQADFALTDQLKLTAGVRYTDSKFEQLGFRAGTVIVSPGATQALSQGSKPVTPKFGVQFQADRNNLFYANAAKGYRIGGAASPAGARCATDAAALGFDPTQTREIEPDSVWSYEVGSKNKLFDNRVTIDASAYRIDWSNIQTALTLPNCGIPTTLNFGDARSQGFDIAVTVRPLDGLNLGASVGYNDAKYTSDFVGAGGVILRRKGEPLGVSPWKVYLNGEYEFPMGGHAAYVRADYVYTSHDDTPLDTASPLINPDIPRYPATHNLDLRAGMRFDDFDVSLFVANLTNDNPRLSTFEESVPQNYYRASASRPRTFGLTATLRQ